MLGSGSRRELLTPLNSTASTCRPSHARRLFVAARGVPVIASADSFTYTDPVDGSVSRNQGLRIVSRDGGRLVFRLSGTGTRGATLRVYLERHEPDAAKQRVSAATALAPLSAAARAVSRLEELTGIAQPTMVT